MDSRLEIVTSDDKDIGVNLIVANNLVLFSGEMLKNNQLQLQPVASYIEY